jgi:hypothetical protein
MVKRTDTITEIQSLLLGGREMRLLRCSGMHGIGHFSILSTTSLLLAQTVTGLRNACFGYGFAVVP